MALFSPRALEIWLDDLRAAYWQWRFTDAVAPYADGPARRQAPINLAGATGIEVEAPAFFKPGLAATLYPEFFRPDQGMVDKDGLVDYAALTTRFRLEPDLIGHPDGARRSIELEYWRGLRFDDDIASGVSEHKATGHQRGLEGIDKTQIWWTSAARETRAGPPY